MERNEIPFKQKAISCIMYLFNILMFFFPWITVGEKHYNIIQLAITLKKTGLDALTADVSLDVENMDVLNIGIWAECGFFLIFGILSVIYIIAVLRNRKFLWNVFALIAAAALCMLNTFGSTIPALNGDSIFMWCFPLVFLVSCGIEFIAQKAMEQDPEIIQKMEKIQEEEKAQKKEEKERLEFEGRYSPLFYHFLWKNLKKTWRDYVLLVFCSSLVFFFIVVGFGMRTLLQKENNIEGIVQAFGSLSSILLNAMFPLAVVSVITIIILSFYYLRCRAGNYGIFLTLGMRKRTLQYFVALEFVSVLIFTVFIGGMFGTLVLYLLVKKSELFLGVRLSMSQLGFLPYIQSFAALLLLYLVAFMAARDIFVSFRMGNSADLQLMKEKMPVKRRKFFIFVGIVLMFYSMFEYRQLRNFEKAELLVVFFAGLYLLLRYGIAEYLLRERKQGNYLHNLLLHNQIFHRSKTNTAYIVAMSVLLFCVLFYFPFQFISVLLAEDEDILYPYDIVCMANEGDQDIFGRMQEKYQVTLDTYPMMRVTNLDSTEKTEGVMEPPPPQGEQIGISESTYQALKKRIDSKWKEKSLHLDSRGESVYIVHQQDKSIKAQPVDYWLSRKEPVLHIGVPIASGVNPYSVSTENTGFFMKKIKGEEIGSLIGVFGQGKWDNLIVFSDEYFKKAQELWKRTEPATGILLTEEEVEEYGYTEDEFIQGPSELVLIQADEKKIPEIEKELKEFRARHTEDESYNNAVQSCYIKKNEVQKLRTERVMKSMMNVLMFLLFLLIYFVLLAVKILMERGIISRRSEFLACMGMRGKDRKCLICSELFRYFYILPVVMAALGAGIFTALVFYARQYQPEDIKRYLDNALPLWLVCLIVTGMVVRAAFTGYAYKVERWNEKYTESGRKG